MLRLERFHDSKQKTNNSAVLGFVRNHANIPMGGFSFKGKESVHPRKLTLIPKMMVSKR